LRVCKNYRFLVIDPTGGNRLIAGQKGSDRMMFVGTPNQPNNHA
jgi:hypothetical protein